MSNPNQLDIVALQDDLTYGLMSWELLNQINIVSERKMRLENQVQFATIYDTIRNGCAGIGIVVEMPTIMPDSQAESAPGPAMKLGLSFLVVECPAISESINGPKNMGTNPPSILDAEQITAWLIKFLHQWFLRGQGELVPDSPMSEPARELPGGTLGYRVKFFIIHAPTYLQRVTIPTPAIDPMTFELSFTNATANADADIWYSMDDSFPGPANDEGATLYTGPIPYLAPATYRFAAFQPKWMPSSVDRITVAPPTI